jgi:hypothetical protein
LRTGQVTFGRIEEERRISTEGTEIMSKTTINDPVESVGDPAEAMRQDRQQVTALLAVSAVRYAAFCERFGRDPEPDEPLLFDPSAEQPVPASLANRVLQAVSAALLADVDAELVLNYLGLPPDGGSNY